MTCSKCGRESTGPQWHEQRDPTTQRAACRYGDVVTEYDEHLHYYCACGFDWIAPTREQAIVGRLHEGRKEVTCSSMRLATSCASPR